MNKEGEKNILRTCDLPRRYRDDFDMALSTLSSLSIEGIRFSPETLQQILESTTKLSPELIEQLVKTFKEKDVRNS